MISINIILYKHTHAHIHTHKQQINIYTKADVRKHVASIFEDIDTCEATNASILLDIGIPAKLDALENPVGVPQSILDESKRVSQEGGIQEILTKLQGE